MTIQEALEKIVDIHIQRYRHQYEMFLMSKPGYTSENGYYLSIWRDIKAQGCNWALLYEYEKQEARDAIADEGWQLNEENDEVLEMCMPEGM